MEDRSGRPRNWRNDPAPISTDLAALFGLLFTEFYEIVRYSVMVRDPNSFFVK